MTRQPSTAACYLIVTATACVVLAAFGLLLWASFASYHPAPKGNLMPSDFCASVAAHPDGMPAPYPLCGQWQTAPSP